MAHDQGDVGSLVAPADFCRLLTSPRRLERHDDERARLRGLRDPSTGVLYVIDADTLDGYVPPARRRQPAPPA